MPFVLIKYALWRSDSVSKADLNEAAGAADARPVAGRGRG